MESWYKAAAARVRKKVAQHEAQVKEAKESATMTEPDEVKPKVEEDTTKPQSSKLGRPGWGKNCLMAGRCPKKHPPEHCLVFKNLKPDARLAASRARGLCDRCMTKVRTKEQWSEIMRCGVAGCGTARPWQACKRHDNRYPSSKRWGERQGVGPRQDIWVPVNRGSKPAGRGGDGGSRFETPKGPTQRAQPRKRERKEIRKERSGSPGTSEDASDL